MFFHTDTIRETTVTISLSLSIFSHSLFCVRFCPCDNTFCAIRARVYVCMHVCIPLKRCATDVSASIQFYVVQVPACVMRIKCCKYVCGFTHIHNCECTLHTAHGIYRNIQNSIQMMGPIPVCIAFFVMHFIRCTQVFHVLTAIHTVWNEVNILTRRRS